MARSVSCSIDAIKAIRGDKTLSDQAYRMYLTLFKAYIESQANAGANSKYLSNADTTSYFAAYRVFVKIKDLQLSMKKPTSSENKEKMREDMKLLLESDDFKNFEKGTLAFHKVHRPFSDKRTLLRIKNEHLKKYDSVSAAQYDEKDFNKVVTIEDTFEALLGMIESVHDDDGIKVMYDDRYVYNEFKNHGFYGPSIMVCGFMLEACSKVGASKLGKSNKGSKSGTKKVPKKKRPSKLKMSRSHKASPTTINIRKPAKPTTRRQIIESSDEENEWNDDNDNLPEPELSSSTEKVDADMENQNSDSPKESTSASNTPGSSKVGGSIPTSTRLTELFNAELLTNLQNEFVIPGEGDKISKEVSFGVPNGIEEDKNDSLNESGTAEDESTNVNDGKTDKKKDNKENENPDEGGNNRENDGSKGKKNNNNDKDPKVPYEKEKNVFNVDFLTHNRMRKMSSVMLDLFPAFLQWCDDKTYQKPNIMILHIMDINTGMCFFRHIPDIREDVYLSESILSVFGDCGFPSQVSYYDNGKGFNRNRYSFHIPQTKESRMVVPLFDDTPFGHDSHNIEVCQHKYLMMVSCSYLNDNNNHFCHDLMPIQNQIS